MAQLTLKFKEMVLKEFSLDGGSKTIGRELGNDIVVENLLVSGYHARVDEAGNDYILTDLQSKNGTFVNSERVTSAKLKHGDQILIGKHLLVFGLDVAEGTEEKNLAEPTMFIEVAQGGPEAATPKPDAAHETSSNSSFERTAVLSLITGNSEEYKINKKLIKLGKGHEADIHIGGLLTPKVAATISTRPTGYHLTPVGRTKVKVNGTQIQGSYRLKEFDTVEVGPLCMQFYYKS
ncbi:MAG: FHA domain-containing protein [Deltaproteobacteria bacterium]|nr:MAG: FHA domain-containing protein [Deltaproteobacteria bacterium]